MLHGDFSTEPFKTTHAGKDRLVARIMEEVWKNSGYTMIPGRSDVAEVIGVDLGATHVRAVRATVAKSTIELGATARRKVGARRAEDVAKAVASAVRAVGGPATSVGVAAAAQLSKDCRTVLNAPNFGWRNTEFADMLEQAMGCSVVLENDINAAALAEAGFGAGKGFDTVLVVLLGSGIGAGLVTKGRVYRGGTGVAGEIGHVKVRGPRSRLCGCGQRGCLEAYVGGVNLARRVSEDLERGAKSSLQEVYRNKPGAISTALVEEHAFRGDEFSQRIWSEAASMLGRALADAVTLFNPDVLLLGGGGFIHCPRLSAKVSEFAKARALKAASNSLVVRSAALGDQAGALGAALLAAGIDRP